MKIDSNNNWGNKMDDKWGNNKWEENAVSTKG
jgi:hypothetical protein